MATDPVKPVDAMVITKDHVDQFERFFQDPSPERIHAELDWDDFERFLAYVFFCGGYVVEHVAQQHFPHGPGVDLNLYLSERIPKPAARIEAKRYEPGKSFVNLDDVARFAGFIMPEDRLSGYLITTSDFTPTARTFGEERSPRIRLINGIDLMRYITYIRGSRVRGADGFYRTPTRMSPDWLFSSPEPQSSAHVLAIANNKGGVGKTTTALNVALALADKGQQVLLIDLDSQANLSAALPLPLPPGAPKNAPIPIRQVTLARYFGQEHLPLAATIQKTRFENVYLAPSDQELRRLDPGGGARPDAELAFASSLCGERLTIPETETNFDWIVIDTPPSQGHYTRIALASADYVLVPVRPDTFTRLGINEVMESIRSMSALVGATPKTGIVVTQWKETRSARLVYSDLLIQAPIPGFTLHPTKIPYDDRIEQAHIVLVNGKGAPKPVFGFGASIPAATAYRQLVADLMQKMR